MGQCLNKASYGKDTEEPDYYGYLTLQTPLYCGCCNTCYPCFFPESNQKHSRPRVLSLQGLSATERKLWKCVASGNPGKARELLEKTAKKEGASPINVQAIRLEGCANLLVALSIVDYSTFSVESAQFLLNEHHLDINHVSEETGENALMAALKTFTLLQNVKPCECCAGQSCCCNSNLCVLCCEPLCCCACFVFEEDTRRQHCLELATYLVETGIDVDYHGLGTTAIHSLLTIFCKEATREKDSEVDQEKNFDPKSAVLALAETVVAKMTTMDFQSEKTPHILHQLLDSIRIPASLLVVDVKSLLQLTGSILRTKTSCLDINCRAANGQGDNLLCAYTQALAETLGSREMQRIEAVFHPILELMNFICKHGVDVNFVSQQDDCNALQRTLNLITTIDNPEVGELVGWGHELVELAHLLVERGIDINHTGKGGVNALHITLGVVKHIESESCEQAMSVARDLVDFSYILVARGIDVNYTPADSRNAFYVALGMVTTTRDKKMPAKLVKLCLLLIEKGITLGSEGQVHGGVLFEVFKMIENHSEDATAVESLFELVVAIIEMCKIDLNHREFVESLKTEVTPLLLVLRAHGRYQGDTKAPAGYMEVAHRLLQKSSSVVSASKIEVGDQVTPLLYVMTKYVQTARTEWWELLKILLARENTNVINAETAEIEAVDFSVAHLLYPEGMPISKNSVIPKFMFKDGSKVSCLGMVVKALVNGPEEEKPLEQDLKQLAQSVKEKGLETRRKQDEVDDLQQKVDNAQSTKDDQAKAVDGLRIERDDLNENISNKGHDIKEASEQHKEAQRKLQENSDPSDSNSVHPDPEVLHRKVEEIEKRMEAMKKDKVELEKQRAEKETELSKAESDYGKKEKEYDSARAAHESAETKLKDLMEELDNLRKAKMTAEHNNKEFCKRLYPEVAARLQETLDLLLRYADACKSIDSTGDTSLTYIINSAMTVPSWETHAPAHGDQLVTAVEKILKSVSDKKEVGKTFHYLIQAFGSTLCHPERNWWTKLETAVLNHDRLDIDYKLKPSSQGFTPLLALLKKASEMEDIKNNKIKELFKKLLKRIVEDKKASVNVAAGPEKRGTLYYLLLCHTKDERILELSPRDKPPKKKILDLSELKDLLKWMLDKGMPANAMMFDPAETTKKGTVACAHLAYMDTLCYRHGSNEGLADTDQKEIKHIKEIMALFLDRVKSGEPIEEALGEDGADMPNGYKRGYVFFLWDLFHGGERGNKKLNMKDLHDLFYLLEDKYKLNLSASCVGARPSWGVFDIKNQHVNVSILMLVVDAIEKLNPLTKDDIDYAVKLADLVLGKKSGTNKENQSQNKHKSIDVNASISSTSKDEKNQKSIDVNASIPSNKENGHNTVLHFLFQNIIQVCLSKDSRDDDEKKYKMLEALLKGKDSVERSLGDSTEQDLLKLYALLKMLVTLQDFCDFGSTAVIHKAYDSGELVKELQRDGFIPTKKGTEKNNKKNINVILESSGWHPVEDVLYGALPPSVFHSKEDDDQKDGDQNDVEEIERRFKVAEYLLRYLLDKNAEGPHKDVSLSYRKDSPESIVYMEGNGSARTRVFSNELGLFSRFSTIDPLVFTLTFLIKFDPDLKAPKNKHNDTSEPSDSYALKIAELLLEKGADPNAWMLRERAPQKELWKSRDRSAGSKLPGLDKCPLLLLAFDALQSVQAPVRRVEETIGLLLGYGANPMTTDENKGTLLMRIAMRALSCDVMEPFCDKNGEVVHENAADDCIDSYTDIMLKLKGSPLVERNFANLPNLSGKHAFLLGMEEFVKNRKPYASQTQIIHQLLDMGACPILKDPKGACAANLFLTKGKDRDAKDVMLRAADKFEKDYDRALTAENGDVLFLEKLVETGAVDTTSRFKSGDSLAIWAASTGRADVLSKLLLADRGEKLFTEKVNFMKDGNTILHMAVENMHLDVVRILLDTQQYPSCGSVVACQKLPLKDIKDSGGDMERTPCELAFERYKNAAKKEGKEASNRLKICKVFKPSLEDIMDAVQKGEGLGLMASIIREILIKELESIQGTNDNSGGEGENKVPKQVADEKSAEAADQAGGGAKENREQTAKVEEIANRQPPSLAAILNQRYRYTLEGKTTNVSILMMAARYCSKPGAKELVDVILDACDALENGSLCTARKKGHPAGCVESQSGGEPPSAHPNSSIEDQAEKRNSELPTDKNGGKGNASISKEPDPARKEDRNDVNDDDDEFTKYIRWKAGDDSFARCVVLAADDTKDGEKGGDDDKKGDDENKEDGEKKEGGDKKGDKDIGQPLPVHVTSEDDVKHWVEDQKFEVLRKSGGKSDDPEEGLLLDDPMIVDVVDKSGKQVIVSYVSSESTTVRKWREKKKDGDHMRKTAPNKEDVKFFWRPRALINSLVDEESPPKRSALYYAVKHSNESQQSSEQDIVEKLVARGATFDFENDEHLLERCSNAVKKVMNYKKDISRQNTTSHCNVTDLKKGKGGENKYHLFMSHAQGLSQQSIFEVVRHLEELTNYKIKIWTDQRVNPTPENMRDGVRNSEKFVFYMGTAESTRLKSLTDPKKRDGGNPPQSGLEDVRAWLKRVYPTFGVRPMEHGKGEVYDHPATIWRFWCLYELACAFDLLDEKGEYKEDAADRERKEKTIIFIAEGNSRQAGGSGEAYSGESKGRMEPYKRQIRELRKVMEDVKNPNRLANQDDKKLPNKGILCVLDKLEKAMGPNNEVIHWPSDPYDRPGVAKKLLETKIFPNVGEDTAGGDEGSQDKSQAAGADQHQAEKGQPKSNAASDNMEQGDGSQDTGQLPPKDEEQPSGGHDTEQQPPKDEEQPSRGQTPGEQGKRESEKEGHDTEQQPPEDVGEVTQGEETREGGRVEHPPVQGHSPSDDLNDRGGEQGPKSHPGGGVERPGVESKVDITLLG